MNNWAILTGAAFGALAIILGAFGAHALKKVLTEDKLASFETGVKYQLYNALFLLIIGFNADFSLKAVQWSFYLVSTGTLLFSVSIYLLSLAQPLKTNMRFLGPVTPLGGLMMIAGWVCLIVSAIN
ncbi:DUF423 domain-containing protein [Pedobacter montanisoli]|uniref:DUF423 domain-containing protein n=1 Tax=Pedobacter montanisoli TaxID=2923277 RepID=A0ABS9ZRK9_9SPHI|nr:DUF423 domain-containing protein [Pedobacter montanisoli]MCJ0741153.1 DUF423 domain-containing protein [Pedobacter montanisoli]